WVEDYPREDVTWHEERSGLSVEEAVCISFGVVATTILVFSLLQFVPFRDYPADDDTSKNNTELSTSLGSCKDEYCFEGVSIIGRDINADVHPCHDFYRFACGKFSGPSQRTLDQMIEDMYSGVLKDLESLKVPKYSQKAVEKAAGLYQACRSVRENGLDESESLRSFMDSEALFLTKPEEGDALEKITRLAFQYNINAVLEIQVEDSTRATSGMQLKVTIDKSHVDWAARRAHVGHGHSIEFYKRHMVAYGLREDNQVRAELIKHLIDVDKKVAGWLPGDKVSCLQSFITVPFSALNTYTSNIRSAKWTALLANQSTGVMRPEQQIYASPCALEYFNNIYGDVKNSGVNLLVAWEVLRLLAPLSYPAVASLYDETSAKRSCLAAVLRVMEMPAVSAYLFKFVPLETVGATESLLENIRQTALIKIDSAYWVEEPSKASATRKLSAMELQIVYPGISSSKVALNQQYKLYPITGCSFLNTWLEASRLTAMTLAMANFSYSFQMKAPLVTYLPTLNRLRIRAPILRPPLFVLSGPSGLNYGGLGHMIAHEMLHAFDLTGTQANSSLNERYWWTPLTGQNYTDQVLCFRRQHDQIVREKRAQPSNLTDSDNMADIIGLWLAFQTFKDLGDKQRFEDLPYDAKQLFFIASCIKLCAKTTAEAPNSFRYMMARCNVPLMSSPEFAEAFNCPRGTAMNPWRRCELWDNIFCSRN
ncbi:unnamed protein product, partial [Ixodes hexagonus]